MLERLAGPFTIHDSEGTPVGIGYNIGSSQTARYVEDVGLLGFADATSSLGDVYVVIQLDGVAHFRANLSHRYQTIPDLPGQNILIKTFFNDSLCQFDKRAGTFGPSVLGVAYPAPGYTPTNYVYHLEARVSDRYLHIQNERVYWRPLDDPTTETLEYAFTGSLLSVPAISSTNSDTVVCLCYPDGTVVWYDWELKTEVFERKFLPANSGAWYSPKLDIFVALIDHGETIAIYSATPAPAALSAPEAMTPLRKGQASTIRTQLTGSNSEPCPGETITWSMTGPGTLTRSDSTTDASGYATVEFIAPLTLSTDPEITATVRF